MPSETSLRFHKNSHKIKKTREGSRCTWCDEIIYTQKPRHERSCEMKQKRKQNLHKSCDICCNDFKRKPALMKHIKTHEPKSKKFSCDQCDKSYTNVKALDMHLSRWHESIVCPHCNITIHSSLKRHVERSHKLEIDGGFLPQMTRFLRNRWWLHDSLKESR